MFGKKEAPPETEGRYKTIAAIGMPMFDKVLNKAANEGWRIVALSHGGTTLYAVLEKV